MFCRVDSKVGLEHFKIFGLEPARAKCSGGRHERGKKFSLLSIILLPICGSEGSQMIKSALCGLQSLQNPTCPIHISDNFYPPQSAGIYAPEGSASPRLAVQRQQLPLLFGQSASSRNRMRAYRGSHAPLLTNESSPICGVNGTSDGFLVLSFVFPTFGQTIKPRKARPDIPATTP